MNEALGDGVNWNGFRKQGGNMGRSKDANGVYTFSPYFTRLSALVTLTPSVAFVFIDQHPDSIRGTSFEIAYETLLVQWRRLPASYHGGGCTMCFADGHAEYKKWLVPQTRQPVTYVNWGYTAHPETTQTSRDDYDWLLRRMYEPALFQ
jgi:prepilin-type processing-associated H-X9-DG protein